MLQKSIDRKFNWISSSVAINSNLLHELDKTMLEFYSSPDSRDSYQQMIDENDINDLGNPGVVISGLLDYIKQISSKAIMEVGCGTGRIYRFLEDNVENLEYIGIELSENVITLNRKKFPKANWYVADGYNIPAPSESVDVCLSFYVLEHLVYPEKSLIEMLRIVKKGGHLILVFPDFVTSGRFASQKLGMSDNGTAKQKLEKGKFIDALVSLYDSRIRLPFALSKAVSSVGPFPVNLTPKCLSSGSNAMFPDIDAVYIASKKEVKEWAERKGHETFLPKGDRGLFKEHAFISIRK